MKGMPHEYYVIANGAPEGRVNLSTEGAEILESSAPAQFGGPGDRWSPEDLLVAAAVDCLILTFRAISRPAKVNWTNLECSGKGILDRDGAGLRFTHLEITATLHLAQDSDVEHAEHVLRKAKDQCLVTRSMNTETSLKISILLNT
jgi:organic hydroperoxide reductase OsmC/OhrA